MKKAVVYSKKKNEKGAITLFVLLACLFFVFILTGVYISNTNKLQMQEEEVRQIQENYAKELERVDEIYEEMSTIVVKLTQNPEKGTWTSESVTLTGTAQVKEEGKAITEYAFSKDNTDEATLEWVKVDNGTEITETKEVTENGTYYFWIKDEEGNIKRASTEVNNIDKTPPTVGSLIAKVENANGEDYTFNSWVDKSVYIEKIDGGDNESGHKKTTITILKNGLSVEEWKDTEGPITLTENGEYTVTVKTEDNAGNVVTSEIYTIKIDKAVPVITLKHNDENGEEYTQGTWTKNNLYAEINLENTRQVEKYQYSENGVVWDDISEIPVVKSIDYTTTFPMEDDKPEWITGPINNNATYYFEVQEDGTLKPNNSGVNSKTANSYFEIDLTDYPDASLDITINATISSESNYDFGFAEITEDATAPTFNKNNTYYIKVSGTTTTAEHTTTITGGKKYYLHIGYSKDGSSASKLVSVFQTKLFQLFL